VNLYFADRTVLVILQIFNNTTSANCKKTLKKHLITILHLSNYCSFNICSIICDDRKILYIHECKHSIMVVASIKYPPHNLHVNCSLSLAKHTRCPPLCPDILQHIKYIIFVINKKNNTFNRILSILLIII